ncbi:hypothetical protein CLV63_10681 [Murinocardiopsis flavida]|uniref:Uncharacterized protein n=1 Tax=Murinocardiopsis flavida TaxID=645275 RepID=A0A2P8DLD2_9ACTN|nr:hypothetical protein [Murinocardiopsis flavida]PSK98033.1 hypothetical protein CLV63_10681 [Murinocardiopsis flavida]
MKWWKVVGLAGFAGVAATGVVIARAERRRRAYTPEEIRERLRSRAAEGAAQGTAAAPAHPERPVPRTRAALDAVRHRAAALRARATGLARRAGAAASGRPRGG